MIDPADGPDAAEPAVVEQLRELTTEDGRTLRYRSWSAAGSRRGTLVLLNGIMSHSGWMAPIAVPLARRGYHVVGADRRGSGLNREGRGTELARPALLSDLRRTIERESAAESEVTLAGWCWGAALAIHATVEPDSRIARLALLTPGLFPSDAVRESISSQRETARGKDADSTCLDSPIRDEMFTRGPLLERRIRSDELRLRRFSPRYFWNMTKIGTAAVARLERVSVPVLLLLARRDEAVDNLETRRELAARLPGAPRTVEVDSAHGIQFEAPDAVAEALEAWLRQAAPLGS